MAEEIKDVNAKIDAAEEAVKKYASKDTVISRSEEHTSELQSH